jgi:hypothetical protein
MKYTILFFAILQTLSSTAQDCTEELLQQKAGTWKAGPQGSIHNINAADLVKEKAFIAGIHKMISSNYSPTGCEVSYSNVFGKEVAAGENWMADPYYFAMYILPYLCDGNSADKSKYHVAISSGTNVDISANVLASFNLFAVNIPGNDFRGYLKMKQRPQRKDGAWFMGEEIVGDYGTGNENIESCWLITYNDTLPFLYLSRKEYLLLQTKRLEQSLKDNPGEKEYTNKFISNINEYLKKSEDELSQDAICMWNDEERFGGFVEEGTRGSFIAVKPNLDYYRKKLNKSSPQFFTVVYKVSKGDPVCVDNIAAIKKAVDFPTLKNMLGK